MKDMKWKVIKTEHDYDLASNRLDELISSELIKGSNEYDEYELLCLLVHDYENKHYKFDKPDPIDHIKFIMEQNNLSQKDMIPYFGTKYKVSEVLSRKRNLSKQMIKKLHAGLGIPFDILLQNIDKIDIEQEIVIKTVYKTPSLLQSIFGKVTNKQLVDYNNHVSETEDNYEHKSIEYGSC